MSPSRRERGGGGGGGEREGWKRDRVVRNEEARKSEGRERQERVRGRKTGYTHMYTVAPYFAEALEQLQTCL